MKLFLIGFVVHLICFGSVFDIYFRTPLIHGMPSERMNAVPAAKRLVLFVADGLRADSLFEVVNDTIKAPYLRGIIEGIGTWGISHTRVPTESRPGHVAIIGGIYEDPSAIAKGWKENPVEFDSVFNESAHTWSWGSPDILPMFAKGCKEGHVDTYMYSSHEEDFASKEDASKLDIWVFDHVKEFFKLASNDRNIAKQLSNDGNIFFLHLLGLDTTGHSLKPRSLEYAQNIRLVDKGVQEIVKVFDDYFHDDSTSYIFTSDHGMTDWGSHGAGDPSETETPIVAWGAGIATPQDPGNFQSRMLYDSRVESWYLSHVRRHDIHQADIAPLMASLLGIPIPVNSVGILPVEYLYDNYEYRAEALFTNARQMLNHYREKRSYKEKYTLSVLYKPFSDLTVSDEVDLLSNIRKSMKIRDYDQAMQYCYQLMKLSIAGLHYYHNYDRTSLSISISFCFFGWIVCLICQILRDHTNVENSACVTSEGHRIRKKSSWLRFIIGIWTVVALVLLLGQQAPWQYYLYYLTPVCLWTVVYTRMKYLHYAWIVLKTSDMIWELAIRLLVIILGIEILVFSFFLRPLLSVGLLGIAVWPFVLYSLDNATHKSLYICWLGACILLASFTYMPVIGKEASYPMVEAGGILAFLLLAAGLFWCSGDGTFTSVPSVLYLIGGLILICVYLVHTTAFSIQMKDGLPIGNQLMAWIILVGAFVFPLYGSKFVFGRLVSIIGSLMCPFILLSIRHEAFFYLSLSVAMFLWVFLEYSVSSLQYNHLQVSSLCAWKWQDDSRQRLLDWSDIRRAFFFLFFIILAFFGTGNLASINSFDPSFVYCFVTVFSPFIMGGLLLLKILIPFLLVTCFFHAICYLLQVPVKALFLVFLVLSDLMAVHFFFFIKTDGSWLDIGTSLSHYVISMVTTLFLLILLQVATFLNTISIGLTNSEDLLPSRMHTD